MSIALNFFYKEITCGCGLFDDECTSGAVNWTVRAADVGLLT
jgi:hypothetical protein